MFLSLNYFLQQEQPYWTEPNYQYQMMQVFQTAQRVQLTISILVLNRAQCNTLDHRSFHLFHFYGDTLRQEHLHHIWLPYQTAPSSTSRIQLPVHLKHKPLRPLQYYPYQWLQRVRSSVMQIEKYLQILFCSGVSQKLV